MTDRTDIMMGAFRFYEWYDKNEDGHIIALGFKGTLDAGETFTRSNGTIIARLYERLTKASRRRTNTLSNRQSRDYEEAYRRGVYDAYKALQEELT